MASEKIFADLTALDRCDVDLAWTFVRGDLEKLLSQSTLVCVPSFRKAELYDSSCVFVETAPKTYVPLGKLQDLIDTDNTDQFWHNIYDKTTIMKDDGIPPDFDLNMRDQVRRRKVDVRSMKLQRRSLLNMPKEFRVMLNPQAKPELARAETIHFVNDVIGANELIVSTSDEVNVNLYSIVTWKPILIGFKTFQLDNELRIVKEITEIRNIYNAVKEAWSRM